MKIYLQGIMLSLLSIAMMTLLTLGISTASAKEFEQQQVKVTQNAQNELMDLFFAAARTGQNDVIQEFLQYGFPVDVQNEKGFSALMIAAYAGQQEIVSTLLRYGADRCLRDHKGNTAVMAAIFKLEWGIVKQLRHKECDARAKKIGRKTTEDFAEVIGQLETLQKIDNIE